jgi:predicted RND superfamily exporter protein
MQWLLTRGRIPYLLLVLAVAGWSGFQAAQVGTEKNNESLNTQDAEQLRSYARFKQRFGSDEDLLLAVHDPQLLAPQGLARIAALSERIQHLDGVRQVFSLCTAKQLISGPDGAEEAPLIAAPFDAPDSTARAVAALDRNPDFTGWLVSADRTTAGIVVEMVDRPGDDEYRAALINALRQLMREYSQGPVSLHLTGIAAQKYDVAEYVERDRRVLMPLAVLTLAAVLALFFRSLLGVALPLATTGISVACTLAAYRQAGLAVNAITALLPPVIMVLSIAVSVHLVQGWLQSAQADRIARIQEVLRRLFLPCLFCSLTTALGFGSLMVADMPAVRQFGAFAAFGVIVSFLAGITVVPVGLTFLTPPQSPFDTPQHRLLQRMLAWSAAIVVRGPKRVLVVFATLTVLAALGLPLVRNNTDLVRFLKTSAPLYQDTMFIDAHLTGPNAVEVMIERADGGPLSSLDSVERMAQFEAAARGLPEVTTVTSMIGVLRQLQRAESGGEALALPDNERDTEYLFDLLTAAKDRSLIGKLVTADLRAARVSIRMHAVGTAEAEPLVKRIVAEGRRAFGADYTVTPTGAFYHVTVDSNRLVTDQVRSFGIGLLTVFLAIGLLFRSGKPTLISLVPNVMPIVWTGGLMGFLGIDLSSGTAMIASAVIGLVVDDTIHYLADYYRSYAGDAAAAIRHTTTGIGAALVMNNLALVFGFWVGALGSFKPTIYFSLLSGATMISAMICDLFVTPACLLLFDRRARTVGIV